MHAVELIYEAAGRPSQPDAMTTAEWEALKRTKTKPVTPPTGSCYLTGIPLNGRGVPCASRLKDVTWTGHGTAVARDSEWLSEAAVFSISESATHPDEPKPFKMRTKSHLVEGDEWAVLGMGDKEPMFAALLGAYPHDAPWLLAICTAPLSASHILHQTPVNQPGAARWSVNLGGTLVDGSAAELEPLLTAVNAMYAVGHSKTAIRSGEYNTKWIAAQGEAAWVEMEAYLRPFRGRPIFELALFLAQKGE
jgi:hypothetical protein